MVPVGQFLQANRYVADLGAAVAELVGDIFGDVTGPTLGSVERHDAHGAVILPVEQVLDQRLAVGVPFVSFASGPPEESKIV